MYPALVSSAAGSGKICLAPLPPRLLLLALWKFSFGRAVISTTASRASLPPFVGERHEIWLVDGRSWEVVERHPLRDGEKVNAMSMVKLEPNKASKCSDYERSAKTYLAVGTGITSIAGEDVLSTGRLALFEISDPKSRQGESDVALGPALPPPKPTGGGGDPMAVDGVDADTEAEKAAKEKQKEKEKSQWMRSVAVSQRTPSFLPQLLFHNHDLTYPNLTPILPG